MLDDYRNTKYCPILMDVAQKKTELKRCIESDHPGIEDMHQYVSKNDGPYKKLFMEIYNNKCAYCGVSLSIIPKRMFEVDHFVHEKADEFPNKAAASHMDNLVLGCHFCNRYKREFFIPPEQRDSLHPDLDGIKKSFVRDNHYYIKISETQKNNATINAFYTKAKLGAEIHRLDYLLINAYGLLDKLSEKPELYLKLDKAIKLLQSKRNAMG